MTEFAIVLTTFPAGADVEATARRLVEERLAACVNVLGPMRSVYEWKGEVEAADERQLVIKTSRARVADLQRRLVELHPYEVPEFLVVGIETGSEPYLAWLASAVRLDG
ncbi:MAG: divalent-cation tolerance protein CutA [Vicinamibacterales bacterium]